MNRSRKMLSAVLAAALVVTACLAGMPAASAAAQEPVTLQVFSMPANVSGLQENTYWTDILARDVGVKIELMPSGDQGEQKLAAMMAAHDFPDVVVLKTFKQVNDAIAAGLLLNLDDHKDALPDAYANIPAAIQYYRDYVSNGTGALYALANNATNQSVTYGDTDYGPCLRWDLYEKLGMPPINTIEDYLPVLQKMQKAYPTNADGQKVYGISLWTDWDANYPQTSDDFAAFNGYQQLGFAQIDLRDATMKDTTVTSMFAEDSQFKRCLAFFFQANQMGLLDPDSLTQRWADAQSKQNTGRTLFSYWTWGYGTFNTPDNTAKGVGFMPVYFGDESFDRTTGPIYIGGTWPYGIGANTKNLDAALRFVNYMYSLDGVFAMNNGDKGVYWDLDENGKPYVTELGWKINLDPTLKLDNGGRPGDGLNTINAYGPNTRTIDPKYGVPIDNNAWPKKDFAPADSALVANWKAVMNAHDGTIAYLKAQGKLFEKPFAPIAPFSDDTDQLLQQIGSNVKTVAWQMIFAKDQAEFDSLWEGMVSQAQGMGVDSTIQEAKDLYAQALAEGAKYSY